MRKKNPIFFHFLPRNAIPTTTGMTVLISQTIVTATAIAGILSVKWEKISTAQPPLKATSATGTEGIKVIRK